MKPKLKHRKAKLSDLKIIVSLLLQDELGKIREESADEGNSRYLEASEKIAADPNQYLMVVELEEEIVGTCHLTIMPSLTFVGSTRMQIEAVRVDERYRGQKIGEWMIQQVINYGKSKGASIFQLTSNKSREEAIKFYEKLGFESTHEGMKLYIEE